MILFNRLFKIDKLKITFFLLKIFLCLILSNSVISQSTDSVRYGALPGISYNSDNGINASIELQRFNYSDSIKPFKNFSKYRASYSGIGAYALSAYHDEVQTFGTDKRSAIDFLVSQNYGNYFPGYTVDGDFSKERFDTTSFYQFNSFLLNIGVATRVPISAISGINRTDIKVSLRVVHEKPFDLEPNSFMDSNRPKGWDGSTYTFLELGYLKENRDNEFRSKNGNLVALSFKASVPVLSNSVIGQIYSEFRVFKEVTKVETLPEVVLAQRFLLNQTIGDIPYWFAPSLGGGGSTRGYIYRRFVGKGVLQSNTEIRSWLFKLPWLESQVGISAFTDNGIVYDSSFKDYQRASTIGFGGFMSVFNRDFILKYEMGFSKEGAGVYVGSGFSF